jgi:uncharacterized protein YgbK (DUF1537 family)
MRKTSSNNPKTVRRAKRLAAGALHKRVVAAARDGVHAALRAHKKAGHHVVVVENGKVVRIPPSKIAV